MIAKYNIKLTDILITLAFCCAPALATNNSEFHASFFENFTPKNALDTVKNIPGFTLNLGKSIRGLAGGGGNVLVDGIRVSAKSGGLEEVLTRIPFAQIDRVVVIRGSSKVTDANSQSIVANVIRKKRLSAGQAALNLYYNQNENLFSTAELSYASQLRGWESNLKFNVVNQMVPQSSKYVSTYSNDTPDSKILEDKSTELKEAFVSSEFTDVNANDAMQITSRIGQSQYLPMISRQVFHNAIPTSHFSNKRNSKYQTVELGIDSRKTDNQWQRRTIGLINFNHWTIDRRSESDFFIAHDSEQYNFQRNKWESILRNSYIYQNEDSTTEFGLELTYNDINVNTRYNKTDIEGRRQQIFLPAANVEVSEIRAETFITSQWKWESGLSLLAGVATEFSKIDATGDSNSKQDFTYLKPTIVLSHQIEDNWQSQLRFDRTVNQLDFKLFAAQSDAETGRDQAGNPALKPDSFYQLSLTSDIQFGQDSALQVRVFHQWHQDVLEYQKGASSSQILTNSGSAQIVGAQISLTYAINNLIQGGLITASWQQQKSNYRDVITGKTRSLTNESSPEGSVAFRQDIHQHNFSWGFSYQASQKKELFFVDEFVSTEQNERWLAFAEYRGFSFSHIKLSLNKIGSSQSFEKRIFYQTDRKGMPYRHTLISREEPLQIQLTFNRSF